MEQENSRMEKSIDIQRTKNSERIWKWNFSMKKKPRSIIFIDEPKIR